MSEKRLVDELHASARRNFPRRDVTVTDTPVAGGCDQCILILNSIEVLNILTVIDVLSKYAWTIPLKTKNGTEMATITKIIQGDERCSKNLQIDIGKEFYNANVQILLKKHVINHYSTYSVMENVSRRTIQS